MDVTKSYKFICFGDIHGPKAYKITGCRWAFISQTPVVVLPAQPERVLGRLGPEICVSGPNAGPHVPRLKAQAVFVRLGIRSRLVLGKPAQTRLRKHGPGTGSTI